MTRKQALSQLPLAAFEKMRARWMQSLRSKHSFLIDALSGRRLDIRSQLVPIEVTTSERGEPLPGDSGSVNRSSDVIASSAAPSKDSGT